MLQQEKTRKKLTSAQLILLGFAVVILAGTALLSLPFAVKSGNSGNLIDLLFTATSAVCVTGLVVVDTGTFFSPAGHVVILTLIQIGGLGIITATTLYALVFGKRIGLRERVILKEALNNQELGGVVRLVKVILTVTLIIELIGGLLLSAAFLEYFPPLKALWYGFFHAISGFCNAGFDIVGADYYKFSSLIPLRNNALIVLTLSALTILGTLGFFVIIDIYRQRKWQRLTLHSKLAIVSTAVFITLATLLFFFIGKGTALQGLGIERFINAFFMGFVSRTSGFSTINFAEALPGALLILMFIMFVGACPGGTGGGIKTTTFAVLFLSTRARLQRKEEVVVYNRRIGQGTINRAVTIVLISSVIVFLGIVLLTLLDSHDLLSLMFEAFSAFGTVGLSLGITSELSSGAKLVLICLMFFGRLGPLTLAFALIEGEAKTDKIKYPRGDVIIG
ncbi:MAG: Trk family potassium uptake protein [Syntrophomonadaceae bacterium]|nr:Trk family potassium uptake protein [Syntrophomonadaceae bacterium]